jgi:glycine hydroxymethyltransferase
MRILEQQDPTLAKLVDAEITRQNDTLELIASENHTSRAVLEAMGSPLTDKYAEGYPQKRWYCGCQNADAVEQLAIDRAKVLFGAEHANVQPHSGTSANVAVFLSALQPGETILGMNLSHGGHLSHGYDVNISGKFYKAVNYGVRESDNLLDMDQVRDLAREHRPRMIMVGASAYPRQIDFDAFGEIAREVDAVLVSDIAHIAGLVAAGEHPDPEPVSDFVTSTTHKTLRGPRGGLVLCKERWAKKLDSAVFPGIQGGPLIHVIAAKAVAFHEDAQPQFGEYIRTVIANARALSEALRDNGWTIVSGGTDNHLLLIDLRPRFPELTGKDAADWLQQAGIVANKNTIPFETRSPFKASGIRLGTPAVTTRGMGAEEMRRIADWIEQVLTSGGEEATFARVRNEVSELCQRYPVPNTAVEV